MALVFLLVCLVCQPYKERDWRGRGSFELWYFSIAQASAPEAPNSGERTPSGAREGQQFHFYMTDKL